MHSIKIAMLLSYCVLFWMSANSAIGANINNDTKVALKQYQQSCQFNRDCDTAKNLFCRYKCECIPNMIYDCLTQKCIVIKCDEIVPSCQDGYKCYGNICSQFCDMFSNDCNPAVVHTYFRNMSYYFAFYLVIAIAITTAIVVKLFRYCTRFLPLSPRSSFNERYRQEMLKAVEEIEATVRFNQTTQQFYMEHPVQDEL